MRNLWLFQDERRSNIPVVQQPRREAVITRTWIIHRGLDLFKFCQTKFNILTMPKGRTNFNKSWLYHKDSSGHIAMVQTTWQIFMASSTLCYKEFGCDAPVLTQTAQHAIGSKHKEIASSTDASYSAVCKQTQWPRLRYYRLVKSSEHDWTLASTNEIYTTKLEWNACTKKKQMDVFVRYWSDSRDQNYWKWIATA